MIGLGLIAATFLVIFDGPFNWAARIGEYLGACYILVAFLALQRRASTGNVSGQEMLTMFFAEAGYRQLVQTAADAIVVLDPALRVLLWNPAAETIFGYTRDEAVGMSFPNLVLGGGNPWVLWKDAASGHAHGRSPREIEARRRDGSRVPVELTGSQHSVAGQVISTASSATSPSGGGPRMRST